MGFHFRGCKLAIPPAHARNVERSGKTGDCRVTRPKLFNRWAIAGLLLCTAVALLCFSSYHKGAQLMYARSNYLTGFTSTNGYFWFYWGQRYMLNRDDEGLIFRLSAPPSARPADRIGSWDDVYIDGDVWGALLLFRCGWPEIIASSTAANNSPAAHSRRGIIGDSLQSFAETLGRGFVLHAATTSAPRRIAARNVVQMFHQSRRLLRESFPKGPAKNNLYNF